MKLLLIDKTFYPPPLPRKSRYEFLLNMDFISNIKVYFENINYYSGKKYDISYTEKKTKYIPIKVTNRNPILRYLSFSLGVLFKELFNTEKYDIMVCSFPDPFQLLIYILLRKKAKVKILDIRDYWPELLVKLGIIKEKGIIYNLIDFLLVKAIKMSDGIMAPTEEVFEFLDKRNLKKKEVFIRENIPSYSKKFLSCQKRMENKHINIYLTGTANFKVDNYVVEKLLRFFEKYNNIIFHVFSKHKTYFELKEKLKNFEFIFYEPLDKEQYYKQISKMDFLLFIDLINSHASSNKVLEALMLNIPVLYLAKYTLNYPGTFPLSEPNVDLNKILEHKDDYRSFLLKRIRKEEAEFYSFVQKLLIKYKK